MSNPSDLTRLEAVAEVFQRHGVKFIVIGGQAEYIFGSPRVTYDVDLCYQRSDLNLQNITAALKELDVRLRGFPADLPFTFDARTLALGINFTLVTRIGDLDLLGEVEPIGNYERLNAKATTYRVGGFDLRVIDLDDLIQIKQHVNRPKDRDSLYQLLAIKRMRAESGQQ